MFCRTTGLYPSEIFYALVDFPYPSGQGFMLGTRGLILRGYRCTQKKDAGFNVLYPMGWDAFGCRPRIFRLKPYPSGRSHKENIERFKAR